MAEATPGHTAPEQAAARALPPGLDLLWGRRERGKRGPRPGLSTEAIVGAAIRLADAEGLAAISMARVAARLGFTTMSLYRYVASKEELLQLMWDGSAEGAESLVIEGDGWRQRLRSWAVFQRDMIDLHSWITQMAMAVPPMGPNSLHFVELGLATMDETPLPDSDKLRVIGLISSYTLSEARMAADARRAAEAATRSAHEAQGVHMADETGDAPGVPGAPQAGPAGPVADPGEGPPEDYEGLLRALVDEPTYPRLYRLAWAPRPASQPTEREQFLLGLDTILDGVQALIDRAAG